jgi:hypothetical protein
MYLLLLFILCLVTVSPATAEQLVVIHSNIPALFAEGQLLDSQTVFDLPEKSETTVVLQNGRVITLRGPYRGKIIDTSHSAEGDSESTDNYLVTALAEIIKNNEFNTVLRGSHRAEQSDIWLIDTNSTKRYYCVDPSRGVRLSRQDSNIAARLSIKHKPTGQSLQTSWPAYRPTMSWPEGLPLIYGETYTLELTTVHGNSSFKMLVLYRLPENLPTDSHKVVWMAGKGCVPQASLLLASLR